ncbi:hypothetical protein BB561_000683 [Smittium simulii]|uniref:Inner centromere protein ARK-binding domain-containing protein n=1 Tax=Smittium simulii TaxID=133385 RepID=A0A2T9YY36_9FUNG|nr:hypothetical protein BB561_000683 [Smittium simulii]
MVDVNTSSSWIEQRELEWSNILKRKLDLFEETIKQDVSWLNTYLENFETYHKKSKIAFFSSTFKTTTAKNRYRGRAPIDVRNVFKRTSSFSSKKILKKSLQPLKSPIYNGNDDLCTSPLPVSQGNSKTFDNYGYSKSPLFGTQNHFFDSGSTSKLNSQNKKQGAKVNALVSHFNSLIEPSEVPKTHPYVEIDEFCYSSFVLNLENGSLSGKAPANRLGISNSENTRNNSLNTTVSELNFESDRISNLSISVSDINSESLQNINSSNNDLFKNNYIYYYDSDNNRSRILQTSAGKKLIAYPSNTNQLSFSKESHSKKYNNYNDNLERSRSTLDRAKNTSAFSKSTTRSTRSIKNLIKSETDKNISVDQKNVFSPQKIPKKRKSQSLQSTPIIKKSNLHNNLITSQKSPNRSKSAQSSIKKKKITRKRVIQPIVDNTSHSNRKNFSKQNQEPKNIDSNNSKNINTTSIESDSSSIFATPKNIAINTLSQSNANTVTPSDLTSTINSATTSNWISTDQANIVMAQRLEQLGYEQNKLLMENNPDLMLQQNFLNLNNNPMNRIYNVNFPQNQFQLQPNFNSNGLLSTGFYQPGLHNSLIPNLHLENEYQSLNSLINMNGLIDPKLGNHNMPQISSSSQDIYNNITAASAYNNLIQNQYSSLQNSQQSILNQNLMSLNSNYSNNHYAQNNSNILIPTGNFNSQSHNQDSTFINSQPHNQNSTFINSQPHNQNSTFINSQSQNQNSTFINSQSQNQTSAFINPQSSELSLVSATDNKRDSEVELNLNHHEMLNFVSLKPIENLETQSLENARDTVPTVENVISLNKKNQNNIESTIDYNKVIVEKNVNSTKVDLQNNFNSIKADSNYQNKDALNPSSNVLQKDLIVTGTAKSDMNEKLTPLVAAKLNLPPLPNISKSVSNKEVSNVEQFKNPVFTLENQDKSIPIVDAELDKFSKNDKKSTEIGTHSSLKNKNSDHTTQLNPQLEHLVTPKNNISKLQAPIIHESIIPIGQNSPPEIISDDEDLENDQDLIYELMGDLPPDASPQTILDAQKKAIKKLKKIRNPDMLSTPRWATTPELMKQLQDQQNTNPDSVFGPVKNIQVEEIFAAPKSKHPNAAKLERLSKNKNEAARNRQSSGIWTGTDLLSACEIADYNKKMGYSDS